MVEAKDWRGLGTESGATLSMTSEKTGTVRVVFLGLSLSKNER